MTSYDPRHGSELACRHVKRIPATDRSFQLHSCTRFISCFKGGRSARHPSLHPGTSRAETRAPRHKDTRCRGCPKLSPQPRVREGLLHRTAPALSTRARHSLRLQTTNAPETFGLPTWVFSSKGRGSPEPTAGAGKGCGQVATVTSCAGKFWLSAG